MSVLNSQMKKGFMDVLLLKLMENTPMYGYELMVALDVRSHGFLSLKEGTLYPILYRLEDAGYIKSAWEQEQAKRRMPRKYYTITAAGVAYLQEAKAEMKQLIDVLRDIMQEG